MIRSEMLQKQMAHGHRAAFGKGRRAEYGSGCALVWGNRVSV